MTIKIVSLNIRHGGGKRIAALADWLDKENSSVLVLSEWRQNTAGHNIRERFINLGYDTFSPSRAALKRNTVLLAARDAVESREITPLGTPAGDLMLVGTRPDVRIVGCYFPNGPAKETFFKECIALAQKDLDSPLVFVGDF